MNISKGHLGQIPWNKGIKYTKEQRENLHYPKNRKGRVNTQAYKDHLAELNYGRVKVNKDGIEKQIYQEQLPEYLANGWKKGVIRRKALFEKPDGTFIEYDKSSGKRNHKDWKFIRDVSD